MLATEKLTYSKRNNMHKSNDKRKIYLVRDVLLARKLKREELSTEEIYEQKFTRFIFYFSF